MDKIISKDGTQIAYDKIGQEPALALVDGAFCYRSYGVTPDLIPLLSKGMPVEKIALYEPPLNVVSNNDITPPKGADAELVSLTSQGKKSEAAKYL